MDTLLNYFTPVNQSLLDFSKKLDTSCLGTVISLNRGDQSIDFKANSVVVFSVPEDVDNRITENNFNNFREQFYQLHQGNWKINIIDLGTLIKGQTYNDTEEAIKSIIITLVKNNCYPVIIGGTHALTHGLYRAYDHLEKKVNLTVIDAKFDLGSIEDGVNSNSYLTRIIMDQPNNLLNFTNIGYQTFLNSQEEINLIETMLFEAYRLGSIKSELENVEPTLRETDILSIDIAAIKSNDAPATFNRTISGFDAEEICKITRYAGLSTNLSVFGVFEYNEGMDIYHKTSELLAQMIWYYIEGVNYRKPEFPNIDLRGFTKYIVLVENEEYTFYKSNISNRWWMEITIEKHNKLKRHTLIACTYNDYIKATQQEIPKRWLLNRKKLN